MFTSRLQVGGGGGGGCVSQLRSDLNSYILGMFIYSERGSGSFNLLRLCVY